MRKLFTAICCICLLKTYAQTTATPKKVETPRNYVSQTDVLYKTANDWQGTMDVYANPKAKEPTPLVINIHGGGWNTGSKEMDSWFGAYFRRGFAVANINYRLAGTASAPAAIEDVRCALFYLINHAKELNINVNKIVLCGTSAGGHLALLAGVLGSKPLFDADCKAEQTFKIAAIIDKWGISDVYEWGYGAKSPGNNAVKRWLGARANDTDLAKVLSPINYIDKSTPPVFIVHGDADGIVPVGHSQLLYQKLKDNSIKTEIFIIPGGKHGNFGQESNQEINNRLGAFLQDIGL